MLTHGKDGPLSTYGFLVAVDLVDGSHTTSETIAERFADSVFFMEDVGKVDVEVLGKLDIYSDNKDKHE